MEDALPPMELVTGFSCYFILGYFLNHTGLSRQHCHWIYLLGIAGFVATILCTALISIWAQAPEGIFYSNFSINVLLESVAVFVFFKQRIGPDRSIPRWLAALSQYSFGAYLVHPFVISGFKKVLGLHTLAGDPILMTLILLVCVFILSFLCSAVLNHIPVLKKYIV